MRLTHNAINTLLPLMLVLLVTLSSRTCAAAETHSITLESGGCKVTDIGGGKHGISVDGFGMLQKPGEPTLPSRVYCIAIPPGTAVVSTGVRPDAPADIPGVHRIRPGKAVGEAGESREAERQVLQAAAQREKVVYSSDSPYPGHVAEVVGQGRYRKYSLVYVRYTPVSYHPRSGKLVHYPRVTIDITYQPDPAQAVDPALLAEHIGSFELEARRLIVNYDEAQQWYSDPAAEQQDPTPSGSLGSYVVIASDASMTGLEPLINWEKCKGRTVHTVTTEWIDEHYGITFNTRDLAAKVRTFLRDNLGAWSIQDVLLVGNQTAGVPMRYAEPYGAGNVGLFATDYYYAELSRSDIDSWDDDTDAHYGEYGQDSTDMVAEVNVGRIPYTESWTLHAICDRMVTYEYSNDLNYKHNVLLPMAFLATDTDSAYVGNRMILDIFQPNGWQYDRLYEYGPTYYTPFTYEDTLSLEHMSEYWSGNNYGLVAWAAHGGPSTAHYDPGPFADTTDWPDIDDEHPSFIVSASCHNGSIAFPPDSIARWCMMHGCVGLMGYTAMSPFRHAWDGPEDGFIQAAEYYFCAGVANGSASVGAAFRETLGLMWNSCYGTEEGSIGYKHVFITNLYGNPDMRITSRPTSLPNLTRVVPPGWDACVVPRATNNATLLSCHVPSVLNQASTYVNYAWSNTGQNAATDHRVAVFLDGHVVAYTDRTGLGINQTATTINQGSINVRGGRHSLWYEVDFDDDVKEANETDNGGGGQYVWEPTWLAAGVPIERSAPPLIGAHGTAQGTMYDNNDGFGFHGTPSGAVGNWSATGILPSGLAADYDLRLWGVGNYQGSGTGFGPNWLTTSQSAEGCSDFVVVNSRRASTGDYYAGALNLSDSQSPYHIVHSASQQLSARPGRLWNGAYTLSADNVLSVYECYLTPGVWSFYLNQLSGTCDLGFSLYSQASQYFAKNNYVTGGYADNNGAGEYETFTVTIGSTGWYGLVVWKATSRDYTRASSYKIGYGQTGCITVTSPNGGEIWANADSRLITWQNLGTPDPNVTIELVDTGGSATVITPSTANTGSYTWTVSATEGADYKIRIKSTTNVEHTDLSDDYFTIQPRSIEVISPVEDEELAVGDIYKIKWHTTNIANGHVNVRLSRNGGISWTTIASNILDTGSYMWTVTNPESSHCKIKVVSVEYPTISGTTSEHFSIVLRSIDLLSPNGGEVWQDGDVNQITWASKLLTGYIIIEFSRDGAKWTVLESKAPNTGSYSWTTTGPKSTNCRVRVTSYTYLGLTDASDEAFTIIKRAITLTSPVGGEGWLVGEKRPIKWQSEYLPGGHINVELSRDGGVMWQTLASDIADTSSLLWTVAAPESANCMVKVSSAEHPSVQAVSPEAFSIATGSLTITSPNGGETWRTGRSASITWSSANIDGRVNIFVSHNSGGDWDTLATEVPNTGSYSFIAGYPTSPNTRIRVASLQHPSVSDVSDADFTIQGFSAPGRPVDAGAYIGVGDVRFDWAAPPDGVGGIANYFVRIGTAPGHADVFDAWTGSSSPTCTVAGVAGRTYYCRVLAEDAAGDYSPWSDDSDGIAVVAHPDLRVSEAKMLGDKSSVGLSSKVVTAVVGDSVYVQEPDRSSGVRASVLTVPAGTKVGSIVDVGGQIDTSDWGERCIFGTVRLVQSDGAVSPLHITHRYLGGTPWAYEPLTGAGQAGVVAGMGLNNIGLLAKVHGLVVAAEQVAPPAVPTWFVLDDGSGVGVKCLVPYGMAVDPGWEYVLATGTVSCEMTGNGLRPVILIRWQGDVVTQ